MKAILEFNLPEDDENFYFANNGLKYYCVLSSILENSFRRRIKYESDKYSDKELDLLDTIRDEIISYLNDQDLHI